MEDGDYSFHPKHWVTRKKGPPSPLPPGAKPTYSFTGYQHVTRVAKFELEEDDKGKSKEVDKIVQRVKRRLERERRKREKRVD